MTTRYRPPRSGKRSFATAVLAAVVAVGGVFVAIDGPAFVTRASSVAPPPLEETERRPVKTELPYGPSPMPKVLPPVAPRKAVAARPPGPAIYKCEESNGAVTYSQFPCDGTFVDTRPTSSGFAESWSIAVKRSER